MARKTTAIPTGIPADAVEPAARPASAAGTEDTKLVKKPDLLDDVVARTNLKKRDVKPAVEAALALMGDALRDGAELNLPPLGKVRLVKTKDLDGGAAVMTLKLRTPKNATVAARGDATE